MTTAEAIKTLKPPITVEQWAQLEGPPHYELVNGELQEKPEVAIWHEIFFVDLTAVLQAHVRSKKLGTFIGPNAKVPIDQHHGREPDLFFVPSSLTHAIGQNLFRGVPPLVIEILSPHNEDVDREEKIEDYAKLGIGEYWIVDFPNRTIEIYQLDTSSTKPAYHLKEKVTGNWFRPDFFPGLEIRLDELWPTDYENRT